MSEDFNCRIAIDRVRDGERVDLVASEADCRRIAKQIDLTSIGRLDAHAVLEHRGAVIVARGRIKAAIEQACVASGEPVPAFVDEAFEIRFQPEPTRVPDEEVELSSDDLDTVFHDGQGIELGAAIADTLAVSIEPYPRSANAAAALQHAGVLSEEQAGPFAALAALKGKLGEE
ncbi:MAG: DUF177 domain-containing protein [Sphingomicrobium sp.]